MMNLKTYLKNSRDLIDRALDKYLPPVKREPKTIHMAMRYSIFSGGKRIRPILVLEAYRACAVKGRNGRAIGMDEALAIGSAVEMVHAYSLIHDDLPSMDDDDYRRGKKSCHKVFGEANAILSGDALLTLAFNILSKNLSPEICAECVRQLSDAIGTYGMVGGQAIDIRFKGKAVGSAMRNHINQLKTARLFECSAKLGAIASRAGDRQLRALAIFGKSIGSAFQIVDDIADGEGSIKSSRRSRAMACASRATDKAKDALKIFGDNAFRLKEIADLMLKRCC